MIKLSKTKRILAAITAGAMAVSVMAFAPLFLFAARVNDADTEFPTGEPLDDFLAFATDPDDIADPGWVENNVSEWEFEAINPAYNTANNALTAQDWAKKLPASTSTDFSDPQDNDTVIFFAGEWKYTSSAWVWTAASTGSENGKPTTVPASDTQALTKISDPTGSWVYNDDWFIPVKRVTGVRTKIEVGQVFASLGDLHMFIYQSSSRVFPQNATISNGNGVYLPTAPHIITELWYEDEDGDVNLVSMWDDEEDFVEELTDMGCNIFTWNENTNSIRVTGTGSLFLTIEIKNATWTSTPPIEPEWFNSVHKINFVRPDPIQRDPAPKESQSNGPFGGSGGGGGNPRNENTAQSSIMTPIADSSRAAAAVANTTRGTVNIAPTTGATANVLSAMANKGRHVNVDINHGNHSVRINGENVTSKNGLKDLNFAGGLNANVPAEVAARFPNSRVVGFKFAQDGNFGSVNSVTLNVKITTDKNVAVYAQTSNGLVRIPARAIPAVGVVQVTITDFSDLVFVI